MDMVDQLHMRSTMGYVEPSIDELKDGPKVVAGICGWRLHQGEEVVQIDGTEALRPVRSFTEHQDVRGVGLLP